MKSTGARSAKELQRLDYMTGYQDSYNPSNGYQATCPIHSIPQSLDPGDKVSRKVLTSAVWIVHGERTIPQLYCIVDTKKRTSRRHRRRLTQMVLGHTKHRVNATQIDNTRVYRWDRGRWCRRHFIYWDCWSQQSCWGTLARYSFI